MDRMKNLWSAYIFLAVFVSQSTVQSQKSPSHAQDPGAKGNDVVEAVVETLRDSCLYSDEAGFLRRLAYVESQDGQEYMTYRQGYDGGIWQIDRSQFERTQIESARLTQEYGLLQSKLSIDWFRVAWSDLLKPLYSGIAAALLLKLEGAPNAILRNITSQANFWQQQIHTGKNAQDFVDKVNALEQNCGRTNKVDVLFIVDTSSSVDNTEWTQVKDFIKSIVTQLDKENGLGSTGDRVALETFSNRAILAFPFGKSTDLQSLQILVNLAPRVAGSTNTTDALMMAKAQVLQAIRADADKYLVYITDGQSDDRISALQEAVSIKNQGVTVYSIGVGPDVAQGEMDQLASVPVCRHVRRVTSYSYLSGVTLNLGRFSCKAPEHLLPGEYTYPCTEDFVGQLPTDGLGYAVNIKVTDGQADLLASYTTTKPTASNNDLQHTLVPSQPVVIQSKDPRLLTINVKTGGGVGGARSCNGSYTVSVDFMGPKQQQCNGHYLDLLIMWDASLIASGQSFQQMINLTGQLVGRFDVGLDKHRVGVATFDQSAKSILWLRDTGSVPQFLSTIRGLTPPTAQTVAPSQLAEALKWSRQFGLSFQHGARATSGKTVILVTTGVPANQAQVRQEAQLLHNEGVRVVVVAVDSQFDDRTLAEVAGTPLHVEKVPNLASIGGLLDKVTDAACGDVSVQCVEQGIARPCSPDDLINSQYGDRIVGDRNLTANPCSLPAVPGMPKITRFPHPSQLDRFIICDSKNQAYVVLCPLNQLYNTTTKECEASPFTTVPTTTRQVPIFTPPQTVPPGPGTNQNPTTPGGPITLPPITTPTTPPPVVTTPTRAPNPCTYNNIITGNRLHEYPPDRTKYINCTLVPGQANVESCPPGKNWVQYRLTCMFTCLVLDAKQGIVDCTLPNPCGGALLYYSFPTDPRKYIQCNANQEALLKNCPAGQIWNPLLEICDIP